MGQRITFFTGKGGVGKSLVAAAWAENRRQKGDRVLLVELGSHSFYSRAFQWPYPEVQPTAVEPGLWIALWSGPGVLREYILHLLRSEWLVHLFFENRVMSTFLQAAPGLSELALIGKITSGIRRVGPELPFDEIVVDCFSTGHALALLRVASAMLEVVRLGPMAEQCRTIVQTLTDAQVCRYAIVTLDGDLPKNEAMELYHALHRELKIQPHIFLNRQLVPPVGEEVLLECANGTGAARDFCQFLRDRQLRQSAAEQELAANTGRVIHTLPLITETEPVHIKNQLAKLLAAVEFNHVG